ncbi:EIN3-binding F-box protein 1-like [Canna indica]|uniref:EIN3-binding F-box protein 1-like n=1 Tax=Canna indica TaxID=4628 RepID=A0AAQ3KSD2_9LILI|nr:EIN3-binding F-box protein 1-like [Canna indica]
MGEEAIARGEEANAGEEEEEATPSDGVRRRRGKCRTQASMPPDTKAREDRRQRLVAVDLGGIWLLGFASCLLSVLMAALVNCGGSDDICPGGPLFSNLTDSSLLLSLTRDVYCPPRKRSRVAAPLIFKAAEKVAEKKQQPRSIDTLPDECLFEILRRLPGDKERSNSACVSKRWLMLLGSIRPSELAARKKLSNESVKKFVPDLNKDLTFDEQEIENNGYLTRRLDAEEATDIRLASIALGTCSRGGLGKLFIRGSNSTRVTDVGLSSIAHGCPSLRVLSLWKVSLITDCGLSEIADGCPLLEKLDLCQCPLISDKGLIAVAQKCPNLTTLTIESCSSIGNEGLRAIGQCCPKLKSITIKDCLHVGDQGITSLVSSASSSLERIKLQTLTISDIALAVIGHYGKNVTDLSLIGLPNVNEKGFWVMGNTLGLQKLRSISITSCNGLTDIGLQAIAKGSPSLRQLLVHKSCYLSDAGLSAFADTAKALENLHLEDCNRITLVGILGAILKCSRVIKSVSLVRCLGIKDINFAAATQLPSCMSLRSLTIRDCPGVTSASLELVGKICPQLQNIDLSGQAGVTDASLIPLFESSEVGFVEVNLSGCVNVTDDLVAMLVKAHGSSLKMLNLHGCKKITDRSLLAIADSCSLLDDLDLSSCSVGDYGVAILASARQLNLHTLSLASCSKVTLKSLPFLGNLGRSLSGLNLQNSSLISTNGMRFLEEKLWWCDILS